MATQTGRPASRGLTSWKWLAGAILLLLIAGGLYPLGRYAWADWHYRRALRALDRRDFAAARDDLDVCIREWPASAETRFLAARAARRAGDLDAAQRFLKDAQRLGWVSDAVELEQILLRLQRGEHRAVSRHLIELVRRGHPDSTLILEQLAPSAVNNFDLALAMECLDRWLQAEPDSARAYLLRGQVLIRLRDKKRAVDMYEEAVRLTPDDADARLKYALLLLDQKLLDRAKEQFDWLAKHDPHNGEARLGMAKLQFDLGNSDEARTILDQLLVERRDQPDALALRGQVELNEGKAALAEKFLREADGLKPYEPFILHNLAQALERQERTAEAEETRRREKRAEDDLQKMAQLVREVAAGSPDPELRRQIAELLLRNGKDSDAKRWLDIALAIDPSDPKTHDTLADYYDRFDHQRAEQHRKIAKDLRKDEKNEKGEKKEK